MHGQDKSDQHFGLALSGGGFRAALYHLGVIRFLRDAGLLPQITRITSVSGGSIIGAHMVLNWDKYCGSEEQFREVSNELIRLVKMDVRNRIVRRFPFMVVLNFLRRLCLLGPRRQFTRTGSLEKHYEQFLYGDTALLELPEAPHLYILATDLSDGTLCAFCREGLMLRRRTSKGFMDVQTVQMGLATVPMAVAASSAFPGFFPPLELAGSEVGANDGEFTRRAFTDGGIYDNLGLRMFRHLNGLDLGLEGQYEDTAGSNITDKLKGVFVSDAGASLKIRADSRAGGLLRTALRSTDILMDRVNQLELESFKDTPGTVFIPITRLVDPQQDPSAMHPEIQKQVALIRTDLDLFSDLEISALIQHGYCVARQVIRETPHLDEFTIPTDPPWDALANQPDEQRGFPLHLLKDKSAVLPVARKLQLSSARRFISNMFSREDWPTYVLLPLIAFTVLAVPIYMVKVREIAYQQQQVLSAIAKSRPLYGDILELINSGEPERIPAVEFEEVDWLEPLDFFGYHVISDDRIYDLRGWTSIDQPRYPAQMHARFQMLRTEEAKKQPVLRFQLPSEQETMRLAFQPDELKPRYSRASLPDGGYIYETAMDFSGVPVGTEATIQVRQELPQMMANQEFGMGRFRFTIAAKTGLVRLWVLLPPGRPHDQFELYRFPIDHPDKMEIVHATTSIEVPTGAVATFQLINPPEGYRYESRWRWSQ